MFDLGRAKILAGPYLFICNRCPYFLVSQLLLRTEAIPLRPFFRKTALNGGKVFGIKVKTVPGVRRILM